MTDIEDEIDEEFDEVLGEEVEEEPLSMVGCLDPELAASSLKRFFCGLHWVVGGQISDSLILKEEYLNLIRNISMIQAIDIAYPAIKQYGEKYGCFARSGAYEKDIEITIFLYVLRRCENLYIPKGYIGGIFLIYLQLCEGIKLM